MSEESGEKKTKELHITVDSEQMKQMALDLAKEKIKNKELEEMLEKGEGEDKKTTIFKHGYT